MVTDLATRAAADAAATAFDAAAEASPSVPGTYTPADGTAAYDVRVILAGRPTMDKPVRDGTNVGKQQTAIVRASEVAQPQLHDVLTVAGADWTVREWTAIVPGALWELTLAISEGHERSRQGYRLTR